MDVQIGEVGGCRQQPGWYFIHDQRLATRRTGWTGDLEQPTVGDAKARSIRGVDENRTARRELKIGGGTAGRRAEMEGALAKQQLQFRGRRSGERRSGAFQTPIGRRVGLLLCSQFAAQGSFARRRLTGKGREQVGQDRQVGTRNNFV